MFPSKKKFAIVLITASLVFASGCIDFDEEEEPEGHGLVVESFEAVPSEVFSGDDFELFLDVRNMGDVEAREVTPEIYSAGGAQNGEFDPPDEDSLNPPTEEFEGEQVTFTSTMDAPTIDITDETLNIQTNIFYKYGTDARIRIPVISSEERRSREEAGEALPSIETTRVTDGPFTVRITGPSPAIIGEDDRDVTFTVHGNNVGGGRAYYIEDDAHPDPAREDLDKVYVEIESDDEEFDDEFDCEGETTVRHGDYFELHCSGDVDFDHFQEIPVDVSLNYGYRIRERTSVHVRRG